MTYQHRLEIVAHWSAILTAAVAIWAYGRYQWDRHQKRVRLENYLRTEKEAGTRPRNADRPAFGRQPRHE